MMPHFGMTRMTTMLAVSAFPHLATYNNKTFSTQGHRKAAIRLGPFQTESQIPAKQRLIAHIETSGTNLYASQSASVLRETTVASSSVARAKPSIHDAAFWDDDDDDDELLPTAKISGNNKNTSSAYTTSTNNKATTSPSSPGSKENMCVDLTDDTPARKKPAVSSISESLRALDSSDDEDSLFLERQLTKQKPADDQRLSFSSASTTTTVVQTTAQTTTQEVIEID
jgi:hypothetical protein